MQPFAPGLGAQLSAPMIALFSAASKGPSESHSEPSLGAAAAEEPQRTFCTAPSVSRGGVVAGAAAAAEGLGTACGPEPMEPLADGAGAEALVDGLRHKYSGTA